MPGKRQPVLPPPGDYPFLRGPLGRFILRPWFDALALYLVTRGLMPVSRGWAAAVEADGSEEAYAAAMGWTRRTPAWDRRAVAAVKRAKDAYLAADVAWTDALFGADDPGLDACTRLEIERQHASHRFMATRGRFMHRWGRGSGMRWDVRSEREVMHRHGHRLKGRIAAYPAPDIPPVETSHRARGAYGPEYWLRFPTPSAGMGDTAWTHVYEPDGVADPPTLIFLHGVCMEPEMWKMMVDPVTEIVQQGVRVVRPEGPWHGRRMLPGFYGGEPAISRGPMGFLDLFEAWVSEVAVLMDWARGLGSGPVAIGGLSLGALTAQRAATAAVYWAEQLKPDAMILMVTSGDIMATAYHGAIPTAVDLPRRLTKAGWSDRNLLGWLSLLQPIGESAVPPEKTVMLLGKADTVTPFAGGQELAETWRVPPDNLFIHRGGHFSAPLSQYYDRTPLERLLSLLR